MALHGRKAPSAKQARRTSRRVNDAMVGTHVERSGGRGRHASPAPGTTTKVDFSDSRRGRRADRGVVDQVDIGAATGESDADYARRRGRRGYVEEMQAQSRRKRAFFIGVVAAVAFAVAAVAGTIAFFTWSDTQLSLNDSNAGEALVLAEDDSLSYALCVANLATDSVAPSETDLAIMAVRIDETSRTLTFISVPPSISVALSDDEMHPLSEATAIGGDAELVRAVGDLLGVEFAHFASISAEGLAALVDMVGGVAVELPEEVDDPRAGIHVLSAGSQVLDGPQALTLLRASNYANSLETQAKMRALLTVNLADRASSGEGLAFPSVVADGSSYVYTDWSSGQIIALGDALRPLTEATVYAAVVPGRLVDPGDGSSDVYTVDSEELTSLMKAVNAGESPESTKGDLSSVNREEITVEVRNGSGITGAAARCGELLDSYGYKVESVGNVDDATVYPETLVIYKDDAFELASQAIVSDLSAGRVVNGGDFYHFDTNVLVIIGSDWIG